MTAAIRPLQSPRRLSPGEKIRVLIVDDSVVIRRLVTNTLAADPAIEVAGSAANGVLAIQKIPQLAPDVVTLDVEMPEMDGIETLRQIRALYPAIRVLMFSTLTARGAAVTLEALSLGAADYVTKASNTGSLDQSRLRLENELIPRIKQFFAAAPIPPVLRPPAAKAAMERKVVAIGVSTGGPTALARLLPMLPATFPLPVLITQHMPPLFTALLAERLQTLTRLRVAEARDGDVVEPGRIYLAPGDYHLGLRRRGFQTVVALNQNAPENSCRPAVDVMFRAVAEQFGGRSIGVILTGMGQDGLRGCEQLSALGSHVIVQDEESSVVWGMPGYVARAGLADAVVSLDRVVPEILKQVRG